MFRAGLGLEGRAWRSLTVASIDRRFALGLVPGMAVGLWAPDGERCVCVTVLVDAVRE